jgi:hypothetical protein
MCSRVESRLSYNGKVDFLYDAVCDHQLFLVEMTICAQFFLFYGFSGNIIGDDW